MLHNAKTPSPFAHQVTTTKFLVDNRKAFCFNEQGTGKTASAIWASDYLMKRGVIKRVLVICPLSIMESAWEDDLQKFAPHRSSDIAYGSAKKRVEKINNGADYVIINYAGVEIVKDNLQGFNLIIVDEATHYKNAQTKRWKTLNALADDDTYVWMMTGTPAAQSPLDAFGLAKIINPCSVPRYFGHFRDQVMMQVSQFRWVPRQGATKRVYNVLQPAIRFTKDECLDLPSMTYVKREVELTSQQRKYYKLLKDNMTFTVNGKDITASNAAVNMNKLLQISSGAVYSDEGYSLEFDVSNRYKVLKEVINESAKKVLVFVPFKHTIQIVSEKLQDDGISTNVISGNVAASKRSEIFKKFQTEPDPRVLVIQPQSAAHGVTLTAANTVVWWAPIMSLETYAQANARVHRAGQNNKCTVVQLQGSPVERHFWVAIDNKTNIHTEIVELYRKLL